MQASQGMLTSDAQSRKIIRLNTEISGREADQVNREIQLSESA